MLNAGSLLSALRVEKWGRWQWRVRGARVLCRGAGSCAGYVVTLGCELRMPCAGTGWPDERVGICQRRIVEDLDNFVTRG